MGSWEVVIHPHVREWLHELRRSDKATVAQIAKALDVVLTGVGPGTGRPLVDTLINSRIKNLKELRPGSTGSTEIRLLMVFDTDRNMVILVGGDKSWSMVTVVPRSHTASRTTVCQIRERRVVLMPKYTRDEFLTEFDLDETDVHAAGECIDAYIQGWNLAQMRKTAGVTQIQLAKTLGVHQTRVSEIEHGNPNVMSLGTIRTYIEALGGHLRMSAEFADHNVELPTAV